MYDYTLKNERPSNSGISSEQRLSRDPEEAITAREIFEDTTIALVAGSSRCANGGALRLAR